MSVDEAREVQDRGEEETVWFRSGKAGMAARRWELASVTTWAPAMLVLQMNIHPDSSLETWMVLLLIPVYVVGWFWRARRWRREAIGISADRIVIVKESGRSFEVSWADERSIEVGFQGHELRIGDHAVAVTSKVDGAPFYDMDGLKKSLERFHPIPTVLGSPKLENRGAMVFGVVYILYAAMLIGVVIVGLVRAINT